MHLWHNIWCLMRLAFKYRWNAVLSFHATVLNRIKASLADWGANFSEIERFNFTESRWLTSAQPQAPDLATIPLTSREQNTSAPTIKFADPTIITCPTRPASSSIRWPSSVLPPNWDWLIISPISQTHPSLISTVAQHSSFTLLSVPAASPG